jgi:hypothetical protein
LIQKTACKEMGERLPRYEVRIVGIASKHARQTRRTVLKVFAPIVSSCERVRIVWEFAGKAVDIGHRGETLGSKPLHTTSKWGLASNGHHGCTDYAAIDEFAFGKAIPVVASDGASATVFERNDICRRRAHID